MVAAKDYYAVLGVASDSEDVVIRAAYRALMLKYHPDTHTGTDATKRATEINEAYSVLSDPAKRAAYDSSRAKKTSSEGQHKSANASSPPPPPPPPPPRPDPASSASPPDQNPAPKKVPIGAVVAVCLVAGVSILSMIGSARRATEEVRAAASVNPPPSVYSYVAPTPTPSLQSPTPVDLLSTAVAPGDDDVRFNNIEAAAISFSRVLKKSGIAGARAVSEKCHKGLEAAATWQAADYCVAFDFAASHVDHEVTSALSAKPLEYFTFISENEADAYNSLGLTPYLAMQRTDRIRKAAENIADGAIEASIARSPGPNQSSEQREGEFQGVAHSTVAVTSALSQSERQSLELACATAKMQGPATYDQCAKAELSRLATAPLAPNTSSLTTPERQSLELACASAKMQGPATYNRCLNAEVSRLATAPLAPNTTSLSPSERQSLELACAIAKMQGPATYNRCLQEKVGQLTR